MKKRRRAPQEIETTGWVIPSPKNPEQKIRNPLLDALTLISSSQLNLTRALALDGPPADRKTISKKARTVADARRTVEQNMTASICWPAHPTAFR